MAKFRIKFENTVNPNCEKEIEAYSFAENGEYTEFKKEFSPGRSTVVFAIRTKYVTFIERISENS